MSDQLEATPKAMPLTDEIYHWWGILLRHPKPTSAFKLMRDFNTGAPAVFRTRKAARSLIRTLWHKDHLAHVVRVAVLSIPARHPRQEGR